MSARRVRALYGRRYRHHDDPPARWDNGDLFPSRPPHARLAATRTAEHIDPATPYLPALPPLLRDTTQNEEIPWRADEQQSSPRRRRRAPSFDLGDDILSPRHSEHEELRQHLAKRRRLDLDSTPVSYPPHKYGYYGQVVPGRLRLILISCDGGENSDMRSPQIYLGPHNVLRNNGSVYCADRHVASMVFRHADDTTFSLNQVTIVAPGPGFRSPVQKGVVSVSMTLDALTKYLEQPGAGSSQYRPPSRDPLADDDIGPTQAPTPDDSQAGDAPPEAPPDQITATSFVDRDLGEEEDTPSEWLDYLTMRASNLQRRVDGARWRDRRLHRSLPLNEDFSPFTEHVAAMHESHNEEPTAQRVQTPLPHDDDVTIGHFELKEGQKSVTVQFGVPVAGRFILVRAETEPKGSMSVEVQAILASGYGGPRFFQAVQPR